MGRPYYDYIPDDALDNHYAENYYGDRGYFDDVPDDYDPDANPADYEYEWWAKESERELDRWENW